MYINPVSKVGRNINYETIRICKICKNSFGCKIYSQKKDIIFTFACVNVKLINLGFADK